MPKTDEMNRRWTGLTQIFGDSGHSCLYILKASIFALIDLRESSPSAVEKSLA
jgi:hypothetical protein